MAASVDLTSWDKALKLHYTAERNSDLAEPDNPALGTIQKKTNARGKKIVQYLKYQGAGAGATNITDARAEALASKPVNFEFTRAKLYTVASLDNETIEASAGPDDAFEEATSEIDSSLWRAGFLWERNFFRSWGGWCGRIKAGTVLTAAVATLDDPADAYGFFVGMKCQFATTDGTSGSLLDSGEALTVIGIDRANAKITFSANLDTIASITDTSYIFQKSFFGKGFNGVLDYLPLVRTSVPDLGTVVRTADLDKLAGIYRDCRGEDLPSAVMNVIAQVGTLGGKPNRCWMSMKNLTAFILSIHGKTTYTPVSVSGSRPNVGYPGFKVVVGQHEVTFLTSWAVPDKYFLVADWATWFCRSAGKFPMLLDRTGVLHQLEAEDTFEARAGGYLQVTNSGPGCSGIGQLL